jgi:hypothetical protein
MSAEARQALVDSPNTLFTDATQRSDLLDENITQTYLIALLSNLVAKGHVIEFTAIKTDHHDDSALGEYCHFNGWCADCWPLSTTTAGAYLDAGDARFLSFLSDAAADPDLFQIGLAGSAWTPEAIAAAGPTVFEDAGGDHIHLGAKAP